MGTGVGGSLPIDMKQLMFNNLQLLGLDAQAMEASNHIPFNKLMFDLPNKRGSEIVLHFLFQKLNSTMCKEAFRDCWPIHNKKTEQNFRKICSNWLTNIAKEDPDSHLPRINASLFMSPGGEKFYQLLFDFSGYVLQKTLEKDLGVSCSDMLRYPTVTSQNLQLGEVMRKNIVCSSIRHRNGFFSTPQITLAANNSWRETVDEFVKKHRKMSKEIRELDYKIREEEQIAAQAAMSRGSPVKSRSDVKQFDPNFDPRVIKRAQKIQKVRDMWKQLDDFEHSEAAEREVIESIVENTINKHRIDASDITVKVPDMLLRECAEEIRRRNVDNTYHCGKLNLVSVIQLWNLCLHLYLEKLQQVGVPKFKEEVKKLESQCHTQQNYLHNAQALREEMQEKIPELKASVESLRERLDMFFKDMTPTSVRSTVSKDSCRSSDKCQNELKCTPISVNCQLANRRFQNSCQSSEICQNTSSSGSSRLGNVHSQYPKHTTETSVKTGSKHKVHSVKNQHENMYCSSQKPKPMSFMKNDSALPGVVIKETPSNSKNEKKVEATSENKPNISISTQNVTHDQLNSSVILPVIKSNTLQNPVTTHQSRMSNMSHTFTPAIRSSTLAYPLTVKQQVKYSANSLHKHAVLNRFSQTTDSLPKVESHERKSQNEKGANGGASGDSQLQQKNENQCMQSSVSLQNKCLLLSHITGNLKQDIQSGCLECGAICVCGQTAIASCLQYKDESHDEESSLLHIVQEDTNQSLVSCCDTKAKCFNSSRTNSCNDNRLSEKVENAEFSCSEMAFEQVIIDADELSVDHFPASFLEYPDLFSPAVTGIESQDSGISNDTSVKSSASGFEQGSHFGQFSKISESVVNEKVLSNIRDDNDDYDHDLKEIGSESRFIEYLTKSETLEHHIDDNYKDPDGIITIEDNLSQSQELQYHVIDDYQDCDSIITISSVNTLDVPNLSLNESTYSVEHEDKIPQVTKHITGGKVRQRDSPKRVRFHFGT